MYDPLTVAFEIKSPFKRRSELWPNGYRQTWFTIWHRDPERACSGNRRDDSCGWFDRTPGEYADAVAYVLKDSEAMHEIGQSLATAAPVTSAHGYTWARMPKAETLAVCLMTARYLELRRWWNGQDGNSGAHGSWARRTFTRRRRVDEVACELALNPLDNLSSPETPERLVHLIAAAMNRHFRPWWRHPRWHVHHWRIQWHWLQAFNRWAFERCAKCGGRYPWGYSQTGTWGGDETWHTECHSSEYATDAAKPVESAE
jgi:hypothetical protein